MYIFWISSSTHLKTEGKLNLVVICISVRSEPSLHKTNGTVARFTLCSLLLILPMRFLKLDFQVQLKQNSNFQQSD